MMRLSCCLLGACLLVSAAALGQSAKAQLAIANSAKLVSKGFYDELPFQDKFGYFTIKARVDTATYEYIFDTGGYNTATSKVLQNAGVSSLLEVEVGSANQLKSKVKLSKIPLLQLGKASFQDVGVFNFDFPDSPVINCYTNAGLIGKSVIREAIWQIDYRQSVIRVSDQLRNLPAVEKGQKIKIRLDKVWNPYLTLSVNGRQEEFLFDLGFGGLLSLNEKTAASFGFQQTVTIEGEGSIGANGVREEKTHVASVRSVVVGGKELKNQVAHYAPSSKYNLLGSDLAKHFVITLNFKEGYLILTPYEGTESAEPFQTFGFGVNLKQGKLYVSNLYAGSATQQAGLLLNDELVAVNGQLLAGPSECDAYLLVRNLMKKQNSIQLRIKRGAEQKEFRLAKQSPF